MRARSFFVTSDTLLTHFARCYTDSCNNCLIAERTNLMRKLSSASIRCLFVTLALAISISAQQPFNKSEFEARRAKLFEKINDGVAVIFAAKSQFYPVKFRQSPDFYYLTGIEEAGAVLVMVGPNKSSFLFVPRRSEPQVRAEGPGIWQVEK